MILGFILIHVRLLLGALSFRLFVKMFCHDIDSDKNIEKLQIVILEFSFFHKNQLVLLQRTDFFSISHDSIN